MLWECGDMRAETGPAGCRRNETYRGRGEKMNVQRALDILAQAKETNAL